MPPAFAPPLLPLAAPRPAPRGALDLPRATRALPPPLVRPLRVLFNDSLPPPPGAENFLIGLHAEALLGAGELPATPARHLPLAWVGLVLATSARRLFLELRGGCWMRGFPEVGSGRDLLRVAGLGSAPALAATLGEFNSSSRLGAALYFNFQMAAGPGAGCPRIYLLDADERHLHGFALLNGGTAASFPVCAQPGGSPC